jgi:hypothetical protein
MLPAERIRAFGRADMTALAAVRTISIGSAPPYVACTHVHTGDLRASLRMLTSELTGRARPTGVRVPDVVSSTALNPPAFDGPGVRYRDVMSVLDRVLIPPFATFLGSSIAKNIVCQDISPTQENRIGRCTRTTKSSSSTARSMPTPA